MKTIAIMQPYFFPYIGYFQLINAVDEFILYDDVNYINRGWVNRNRILVDKEPFIFTCPLRNPSQNELIMDLVLGLNYDRWRKRFIRTLHHTYKRAIGYDRTSEMIDSLLTVDDASFMALLEKTLKAVVNILEINVRIVRSSSAYSMCPGSGAERIINICRQAGADRYINPSSGQALYSKAEFRRCGIDIHFLKAGLSVYPQFTETFVPGLSIIDCLMFNPTESVIKMVETHEFC